MAAASDPRRLSDALSELILVRGLAAWVVLEQRLDGPRATRAGGPVASPGGQGAVGHVTFARALVAVSERYLELCEDQADEHTRTSRVGWR